jgi:Na+-translocating ferredoxin:NAD+ oxidoreductase RnfD subunit
VAEEASIVESIAREISPKRRMVRHWTLYAVVLITLLAMYLAPHEPVWFILIGLAGFNLITLLNYAEEATNKWKTTGI